MNKLLDDAFAKVSANIKSDLQSAHHVVIGMDCWSRKSLTASYLAISASFFHTSHHEPVHVLLNLCQISHPHTGDMLGDILTGTLEKWNISKNQVLMVVTDNGSNMIRAVKVANETTEDDNEPQLSDSIEDNDDDEAEEDDAADQEIQSVLESFAESCQLTRFPCIAHTLQLVIKELTKNQAYRNLLAKVKDLVKCIRCSSVAQEQLISVCGKTVLKDCSTRWNSVLMMFQRLLSIRTELESVLKTMKRDSLSNTEWARLDELHRLLLPFREQTDILQTDTMSLSAVIPSLLELSLHLSDQSLPKQYSQQLYTSLWQRFSIFLNPSSADFNPLPAAACYLDPTVSAFMKREDTMQLLSAAKTYIKLKVNFHSQCSKSRVT